MRKLKLQMQVTVDGFVAGPKGELNWMAPHESDDALNAFINHLTDTSDTILLGRKMTDGFVKYWEHATTRRDSPEYAFAVKMVETPKVVFSRTRTRVDGKNVRVESGDLATAINQLKREPGMDLVVYGGASFVSSLIQAGLIDEFHFFVNPIGIGEGMRVFAARVPLKLVDSVSYPSGIVVNSYASKTPGSRA